MLQVDQVGELTYVLRLAKMSGVPDTLLCGPAFTAIVPDIRALRATFGSRCRDRELRVRN